MKKQVEIKLSKSDKKAIVENRMKNIAREMYNQEINLKMYTAYGEKEEVVRATKANIEKQKKAYLALGEELIAVEALTE